MGDFDHAKPYQLKVIRVDQPQSEGKGVSIPPGSELEEVKEKAFAAAYPGNGKAPWQLKIKAIDGMEIDDVTLLDVIPEGKIIVDPGLSFVDQKEVLSIIQKQEAERKERKEKEKEKEKEIKKVKRKTKFASFGKMFGGKNKEKIVEHSFHTRVEAIKSYAAERDDELDFEKGDTFYIDTGAQSEEGWYIGQFRGKIGMIPANFVKILAHASVDNFADLSSDPAKKEEPKRILIQATCLHNFEGKAEEELSIQRGDVIMVDVEQVSKREEWLYTEFNGKSGYIPISYIKVGIVDPDEELRKQRVWVYAEVLFAYEAQQPDELSMRLGDIIFVDDKQDDPDWRFSQMNGREGFVPASYIKIISKDEVKRKAAMKLTEIKSQKRVLEEEIRKKKIKDAQAARQKKIREAELEKRRKEAEIKRKQEEAETKKAEMVKQAMWSRKVLLRHDSDDENDGTDY